MSIRIRVVDGVMVALCAARSVEKPGDVYLDDAHHHALAEKFREDFTSEGARGLKPGKADAEIRAREESNNPNREWWDSVYSGRTTYKHHFAPRKRNNMCGICGLSELLGDHLIVGEAERDA